MTTLLIATRNAHKLAEIRAILGDNCRYLTLNNFPTAPAVVEDQNSFAGNATKKAAELARWLVAEHPTSNVQHPIPNFVLADDSGLEVDALNGAPGVHSARFAVLDRSADNLSANPDGNSTDADNNAKLLRLLANVPAEKRSARFRCVIALVETHRPSAIGHQPLFEGACEGWILFQLRGRNGFGYDPLFVPDGFNQTFAELGDEVKNRISHRAKALEKLKVTLLR